MCLITNTISIEGDRDIIFSGKENFYKKIKHLLQIWHEETLKCLCVLPFYSEIMKWMYIYQMQGTESSRYKAMDFSNKGLRFKTSQIQCRLFHITFPSLSSDKAKILQFWELPSHQHSLEPMLSYRSPLPVIIPTILSLEVPEPAS